jgi:hypothetical protein
VCRIYKESLPGLHFKEFQTTLQCSYHAILLVILLTIKEEYLLHLLKYSTCNQYFGAASIKILVNSMFIYQPIEILMNLLYISSHRDTLENMLYIEILENLLSAHRDTRELTIYSAHRDTRELTIYVSP